MQLRDFHYALPPGLIAQHPLPERDASRLLLLDRGTGTVAHRSFRDLPVLLRPGDLLVMNDTRVLPARLYGMTPRGGRVEILLLEEAGATAWWAWLKPGRRARVGAAFSLPDDLLARVLERGPEGRILLEFDGSLPVREILERYGRMPLPPYIKRAAPNGRRSGPPGASAGEGDRERYQTVYAREDGAIAAPTAGLHFTEAMLEAVRARGVAVAFLTLHVGVGTFKPVRVVEVKQHRMDPERFRIPEGTARAVKEARGRGGRVMAVGTTTVRALESAADEGGAPRAGAGEATLFITPGYRFRVVDALLTNFHLPCTTLLMLVSAFAGRDRVLAAYREATAARYRFYSYGDAMLIL
ncbi:MAG: tRNA preQ1(34) S-adenosylmethionine ribosyltransferase-isomerase QueA [candidate division NC10 bacterium]|nr:tRNA preQ1(34) S-adenosylmethionine ribosyltransferase-isomerase QueA [candidate division NC10 bacterium]